MKSIRNLFTFTTFFLAVNAFAITDAQIVQILKVANDAEIDASKLAKRRTQNSEVKSFAEMMIRDHRQSTKDTKALAKRLAVKFEDSADSDALKTDSKNKYDELKKVRGTDFDAKYVSQQMEAHRHVLEILDTSLIPNATNVELKAHLEKTRGVVNTHLEHAKMLETKMSPRFQSARR